MFCNSISASDHCHQIYSMFFFYLCSHFHEQWSMLVSLMHMKTKRPERQYSILNTSSFIPSFFFFFRYELLIKLATSLWMYSHSVNNGNKLNDLLLDLDGIFSLLSCKCRTWGETKMSCGCGETVSWCLQWTTRAVIDSCVGGASHEITLINKEPFSHVVWDDAHLCCTASNLSPEEDNGHTIKV